MLEQLADEEHRARGAVAGDVVLRGARLRDHRRGRVLDLLKSWWFKVDLAGGTYHFVQKHIAVLGQLDVPGAGDQPKRNRV